MTRTPARSLYCECKPAANLPVLLCISPGHLQTHTLLLFLNHPCELVAVPVKLLKQIVSFTFSCAGDSQGWGCRALYLPKGG